MFSTRRIALALAVAGFPLGAQTQHSAANPMAASLQRSFAGVSGYILRAADGFPADKYGYQATPDVRTFAQELTHVADAHFAYCSRARNEPSPQQSRIEGSMTDKAQIVAKLRESVEYCKGTYDAATDATLGEPFEVGRARGVKLAVLVSNVTHDNEHYGKIVTYFRLNGMVPPSSQPRQ